MSVKEVRSFERDYMPSCVCGNRVSKEGKECGQCFKDRFGTVDNPDAYTKTLEPIVDEDGELSYPTPPKLMKVLIKEDRLRQTR
jgi:hypothetical protein